MSIPSIAVLLIPSHHYSIRFYICLWLISTLILMKTYSGIFYSVLTLPEYKEPIETLDDLEKAAKSGEHSIITVPNSFYYDLFVHSPCCGAYHTIGLNIKRTERDIHLPKGTQKGIELINEAVRQERSIIFIYTDVSLTFGVRTYGMVEMHISS